MDLDIRDIRAPLDERWFEGKPEFDGDFLWWLKHAGIERHSPEGHALLEKIESDAKALAERKLRAEKSAMEFWKAKALARKKKMDKNK